MTRRSTLLALMLVVLAALAVSTTACSPAPRSGGTHDGSSAASGTPSLVGTPTGDPALVATETAPGGTSSSGAKANVKAIDAELNAMQKELDSISMPADSDFAPVEGALY